jgi:hypothetical protein
MSIDGSLITDFRSKTLTRIVDQRRKAELDEVKHRELQRAEDNAFRVKWKESVKERRNREVMEKVDQNLIKSVVCAGRRPNVVACTKTSFLEKKDENENDLYACTSDLILADDLHNFDHQRDSGVFTFSLNNDSTHASFEFNGGGSISTSIRYLQRIGAYDLKIREKLKKPWINDAESPKFVVDSSNKLQITEMLTELLNLNGRESSGHRQVPCGFMLQVMQDAQSQAFIEKSLPSIHMFSPVTNRPIREEAEHNIVKLRSATTTTPKSPSQNQLLSQLVENCFVIGPDDQQILAFLLGVQANSSENWNVTGRRPSITAATITQPVRGTVQPSILFQNDNDYPPEMMTLLPSYCYPRYDCTVAHHFCSILT